MSVTVQHRVVGVDASRGGLKTPSELANELDEAAEGGYFILLATPNFVILQRITNAPEEEHEEPA